MKTLLITGAAGFIGSSIANVLSPNSYKLILVDNLSKGRVENLGQCSHLLITGDLGDFGFVDSLPKSDIILHFAGQSSGERSMENLEQDLNDNYISTINLVKYSIKHCVKHFFFASSMSVYGDGNLVPKTNYGIHKLASEIFLRNNLSNSNVTVLRFFNVYGPGQDLWDLKQGMVSIFISQAIFSDKIFVKGSLARSRDFVYIDDLVDFFVEILDERFHLPNGFAIYDIASGEITTVEKLLKLIKEIFGGGEVEVLHGTLGDQHHISSRNSILKTVLKRPTIKIKIGLEKWKSKLT